MRTTPRPLLAVTLFAMAVIGLSSCGGTSPPSASIHTTSVCGSGSSAIALIPASDRSPAGTWGSAPTVHVPSGTPPKQLECAQLITGKGAKAKDGDALTMEYVLATYSTKGVVQSSWTSQPFTFTLGEMSLIPGWVTGVTGMRAGSRRELIIPPSLGYGDESPGAGIAPNDTLVFVLDMQKVS